MNKKLLSNVFLVILLIAGTGAFLYSRTKAFSKCEEILKGFSENHACILTSRGSMVFELYTKEAPKSTERLKKLSNDKHFYDGLEFYRVSKDFVAQGGIQDAQQRYFNIGNVDQQTQSKIKETEEKIETESNWDKLSLSQEAKDELTGEGFSSNPNVDTKSFEFGSLSFANGGPNTNSTEIFIVTSRDREATNMQYLKGRFTNMGKLVQGDEVLRDINESELDKSYQYSREKPVERIKILEIRVK